MKKLVFSFIFLSSFIGFSFAAKLSFFYPQTSLVANCPAKIDVMLDTEGEMTTAMDLKIIWDQKAMSWDTFDINGGVFKSSTLPYFSSGNSIDTSYILLSTLSRWGFNGIGKVGTIFLTPKLPLDISYLHLGFSMIPNKDTDDSNVIVVNQSGAFDALNTTTQLYLPIRSGLCDEQVQQQLKDKRAAIENQVKSQELAKVVMIQNNSFTSQYANQEKLDIISSRFVHNIFIIIVLVLACVFGFLVRYLAKKRLLNFQMLRRKN